MFIRKDVKSMLYTLLRWFLYSLVILFIAWLIPGISVSGIQSALIAIVIIGLINAVLKPLVYLITLPINLLTLGLFSLVINALLFMLAGYLTPGFNVEGFWSALLGSLILSALSVPINKIDGKDV